MLFKIKKFSQKELDRFCELQRLCFSIQTNIAEQLQEGMDEKAVTRMMVQAYREAGAGNFFHLPVALFGARAALPGDWSVGQFFPKKNALKKGDSVILDASPLFDGFMVDTSYSFCFGSNPHHKKMMADLMIERPLILDAVNAGQTFSTIAEDVYQRAKAKGYDCAHEKHPGEVLGHRAGRWRVSKRKGWRYNGFDGATLFWFILKGKIANLGFKNQTPLWNRSATSHHKPTDGLWLVEPHFGKNGVGAKWEEILVIEDGRARWLQDDPPYLPLN
jgi:methionine aminopeptidase